MARRSQPWRDVGRKKCLYKDLKVEMGLTYSKKKKKANVAEGRQWKSSEINWRVRWGATQFKPACVNRGN